MCALVCVMFRKEPHKAKLSPTNMSILHHRLLAHLTLKYFKWIVAAKPIVLAKNGEKRGTG